MGKIVKFIRAGSLIHVDPKYRLPLTKKEKKMFELIHESTEEEVI